jgi:magnesium-transporting ATPase (P-type)
MTWIAERGTLPRTDRCSEVVDLAPDMVPQLRGISSQEAAGRLRRDGPNVLPRPPSASPFRLLIAQMTHFFAVLLWVAAALAFLAGMPALAVAIFVVVVLNGAFAFAQEFRADRAGARLRELIPMRATVRRDDRPQVVDSAELVLGDAVLLSAGDRISADLCLGPTHSLAVDESTLTGESVPVRPSSGGRLWAGTFVVEGEAEAEVTAIGTRTRLAGIADLTQAAERPTSPLARELHRVVRAIAFIAIAVGAAFFGTGLLLGLSPASGFLFAVGVSVALVPEGLLPTVTLSLARASQQMAKRRALVRRLEAVETLGATTFICTDKTGTITRNEMSVVRVWTPAGTAVVTGIGYELHGQVHGPLDAVRELASSALRCSTGRLQQQAGTWRPVGDPMEVALHVLAVRAGLDDGPATSPRAATRRYPFDPRRRRESAVVDEALHLKGAPDSVLPRCRSSRGGPEAVEEMSAHGLRVRGRKRSKR